MTDRAHAQQSPRTFAARDAWMRAVVAADLPHAAVRLAIRIALYLHVGTGRCDPTYATLAEESAIPERTVYRLVALLEQTGWISREGTKGRHSNQYMLLNPATATTGLNPATTTTGLDAANPVTGDSPTLSKRASNPANMVADQEQRRTAKRTAGRESDSAPDVASRDSEAKNAAEPKPTAAAISAAFESFWAVYPKRVAKLAARRALAAAVKAGADPEAMIAGAARYAAERVGQEGRYTKHPATWINAGCWDDESPGGGVVLDGVTGEPVAVEPRVPARSAATGGVQDIAEELARFYEQRGRR